MHRISLDTFMERVQEQLNTNANNHCNLLGLVGTQGALFRVHLASHRYTFIAKEIVKSYQSFLYHKANFYNHLFPIQGSTIPIHLSSINLTQPYFYNSSAKIVHILLIS